MDAVADRNGTEVIATALRGSANAAGTRPEDALALGRANIKYEDDLSKVGPE